MSCERLRSLWETFLDGELPSRQMLELQTHLDECASCSEAVALSQAIRQSARQMVYQDAAVTDELRDRLRGALLEEARSERRAAERARLRRAFRRAPQLAAAAAAAGLLWFAADSWRAPGNGPEATHAEATHAEAAGAGRATLDSPSSGREAQASVALGPQELLDLFIDYHTAPPPPVVTEPQLVPELERDVGVKVPFPSLAAYGAEWQGGSLVRVPRTQPAAYLRYRTRDAHRVTVYVYNASRIPLHASLQPRMVREEAVYGRHWRGYSIAAQLRHGVGYAVATDLDEARSAELVRAITSSVVSH